MLRARLPEVNSANALVKRAQRERDRAAQTFDLGKHLSRLHRRGDVRPIWRQKRVSQPLEPLTHNLDITPNPTHGFASHTLRIFEMFRGAQAYSQRDQV